MIEEPQLFPLKDANKKIVATIYALPNNETVEFKINEEKVIISLGDLKTILFALSNPQEQKDMMPLQMVTQRKYQTMLGIKAQKDIKKGEVINFKVDIPLPPIEKEIMMEATRQIKRGLIRPVRSTR